jgi:hypothetical protein
MSTDIDMKSFAGVTDPVAGGQDSGTNSYQETLDESVVNKEILAGVRKEMADQSAVAEKPIEEPVAVDSSKVEAPKEQEMNFKALREEMSSKQAQIEELRNNLEMMRANVSQRIQQPQEQEKPMFEGMNKDDIPNVGDIERAWKQKEANYVERIEELQVAQQHPDYAEVIEKYVAPLVRSKPHLLEGIQGARNKALFAYELGMMAKQSQQPQVQPQMVEPKATQKSIDAQKIVENARKPGTLSSAGGQSVLSKADYFATMSDKEFLEMAAKNLEGI